MKPIRQYWICALFIFFSCLVFLSSCGESRKAKEMGTETKTPSPMGQMNHVEKTSGSPSYSIDWRFEPAEIKAGEPVVISYVLKDSMGRVVKEFEKVHEKLTHLIMVSGDLAYFNHIHPNLKDGVFTAVITLPTSGAYKLFADITPKDGTRLTLTREVQAGGSTTRPPSSLRADTQFTKTFEDLSVTLTIDPESIRMGQPTTLTFTLKNAKTGNPVADLDPYLGAFGHTVIISQDTQDFLHTHPKEPGEGMQKMEMKEEDLTLKKGGPDVIFETGFPLAGLYKVWGQFNYHGKLVIADFVLSAK